MSAHPIENEIILRQEGPDDYKEVAELIKDAFANVSFSNKKEHLLVDRLRKSPTFIPALSIVAEYEGKLMGYILLTKVQIKSNCITSLALAPVSVRPQFQNLGIGGKLIIESHKIAKNLGFTFVIVLGHEKYYPKFGYELTSKYGIELPFEAPEVNCMIIPLTKNALVGAKGQIEYPKEFFE